MKGLVVSKIDEGVVIDHLPEGRGRRILPLLGAGGKVVLLQGAESGRMGRKDILKLEGAEFGEREKEIVSLLAPGSTLNLIRGGEVEEKEELELPGEARGLLRCPNPSCITNDRRERLAGTRFLLVGGAYRCVYCDATFKPREEGDFL